MKVELNGVQIGYDDVGTGTPVVFIHGFPHDRTLWSQQIDMLSMQVRCVAPDLRGFGESGGDERTSIDQYADDVAGLMTHLQIERAVICGLSMGGYVAMCMWRRHSDRVLALALCDTRYGADSDDGKQKRNDLIALARRDGSAAVAANQITGMLGKTTREKRPDVVAATKAMMERASVVAIVGALTAMRDREDSRASLATVTVPTLVVVGDEDVLTPVAEAQSIVSALSPAAAARLEVIEGSGHATCIERPAAVTHVLADFLAMLPANNRLS
ncbi:MAG: alpha/beta hydrolase [Gemmatimonadota bacterium]|nr:alpha/beta hydrolase [Gemmatimonadota bacterium]